MKSRTPQECVDRNLYNILQIKNADVALHRSAWIEIVKVMPLVSAPIVALHRSAWIEIEQALMGKLGALRRTPQECVDRNRILLLSAVLLLLSHSTGVRG